MRPTCARIVAVVAFAWVLPSLPTTSAVSSDRHNPFGSGEGALAAATPLTSTGPVNGAWVAMWPEECSAPWVVASVPFPIFTGAYGEGMVGGAAAILPALICRFAEGAWTCEGAPCTAHAEP